MQYSTLSVVRASRDVVDLFGGYNHNYRINDGEFFDMKNMTSTYYPILSPRDRRGEHEMPNTSVHKPNGLIAKDFLCYVDGTGLYINDIRVEGLELEDSKKQLISMGAYIIIMPDKKYVNTANLTDYGDIEANFTSNGTVKYEMCNVDGEVYENITVSATEPKEATNKMLWLDTSEKVHVLKQYSITNLVWTEITTTYVKISCKNIAKDFKQYDGVKISGIADTVGQPFEWNDKISILYAASHDKGTEVRAEGTDDYVVVVGILDATTTQTKPITLQRQMPVMDFVIESNNRLWGCRYGLSESGEVVNEIYASKLGDFRNWHCFMGVSTDSYTASCGTDGAFTGAITHLGYPLFFKENNLHKVYGNFPSNYQIQSTACRGVMKGAGNSLAIVNETLYYKSRNGVCAYDGSLPHEISGAMGDIKYSAVDEKNTDTLRNGAVAGSHGNKYYISMRSEADETWNLFVYDASKGLWHKEDNTKAEAFCSARNELYYIEGDKIKTVFGGGNKEGNVEWMVETGIVGLNAGLSGGSVSLPQKKYISQLLLRMQLGINSLIKIYIQYDSCGQWEHINNITGNVLKTYTMPIRPKRCDHFRIRLEGIGDAKILSMTKVVETGSEV